MSDEVVTRVCPICHKRAQIRIVVVKDKRSGNTETWYHIGKSCKKEYSTS